MSKWFYFHIFVLMFSSIMVFLFSVMAIAQCCMTIPNIPKEYVICGIIIGMSIGIFLILLAVIGLKQMIIRVKIIDDTKNDLNQGENNKI